MPKNAPPSVPSNPTPLRSTSFLGVELDSVNMMARLTVERAQAVLNCLSSFRGRNVVPLKQFQRLLGHMASVAAVTPLVLLHMRPLQHSLQSQGGHDAAVHFEQVSLSSVAAPSAPWMNLAFLQAGVPQEQVSRTYCCHNRYFQHGLGRYMQRAGSLRALHGAPTALVQQLPRVVLLSHCCILAIPYATNATY